MEELRLIVGYKQNLSSATRQSIHNRLGGNVRKHFPSINADLVTFKQSKEKSPKQFAKRLCDEYLRKPEVKLCELDSKVEFPSQLTCDLKQSANSEAIALIPEISQKSIDQRCEVVPIEGMIPAQDPKHAGKDGTWGSSPLWAQHAIGADLAAEFVDQRLKSGRASRVPTGNMDDFFNQTLTAPVQVDALKLNLLPASDQPTHGDHTANVVSNPPFGVSPAVTWSAIVSLSDQTKKGGPQEAWNSNIIDALEAIRGTQTRLVTASIGYFGSSPRTAIDSYVNQGRIFVQASGNSYPESSLRGATPPNVGHILVGSVGPNGIQSPFSQEPAKIYAPADISMLSGPNHRINGTSGATPLVSGSIANALAILPHLSNSEVEELLARTSLPSFSQQATGFGPGLLNSYRMSVVAACLADESKDQKQNSNLLVDTNCFDQSSKSQKLRNEANRLLKNTSCMSQRDGLKALRASFLLEPSRDSALRIAEMYEQLGFPGDARWYRTAAAALGTPEQKRRHFDELLNEPSLTVHRYFPGSPSSNTWTSRGFYALSLVSRIPTDHPYSRDTVERIATLAKSHDPAIQERAIGQALIVGPRALPAIAHLLDDDDDSENPRSAGRIIWKLAGADNEPHIWTEQTKTFFKGTRFEKYLPIEDEK